MIFYHREPDLIVDGCDELDETIEPFSSSLETFDSFVSVEKFNSFMVSEELSEERKLSSKQFFPRFRDVPFGQNGSTLDEN